jgi:transcriptional regulator with XRE-family HTH domain
MKTLRGVRTERSLRQYQLAGIARVPVATLSCVETRGMRLHADQAKRLALALGVDCSQVRELQEALDHAASTVSGPATTRAPGTSTMADQRDGSTEETR